MSMRVLRSLAWLLISVTCALRADETESAVRGLVDGRPVTDADLQPIVSGKSEILQEAMKSPEELLRFYGYVMRLAALAENPGSTKKRRSNSNLGTPVPGSLHKPR